MSNEKVSEARPTALAKAGLTPAGVGREQNTYHDDGSVEFVFFSSRGNRRFLARVMVNPAGSASVLASE
jgi:hypothetical protein